MFLEVQRGTTWHQRRDVIHAVIIRHTRSLTYIIWLRNLYKRNCYT